MEQVNNCVIKNTIELSMLGNCFPDWGGGKGFLGWEVRDLSVYVYLKKNRKKEKKETNS